MMWRNTFPEPQPDSASYDMWLVTFDTWHVTPDMQHMTYDVWQVEEGEHSLEMSSPYLMRFGSECVLETFEQKDDLLIN